MKLLESIMDVENVDIEEAKAIKEEVSEKIRVLWERTLNEDGYHLIEIAKLSKKYEDNDAELFI